MSMMTVLKRSTLSLFVAGAVLFSPMAVVDPAQATEGISEDTETQVEIPVEESNAPADQDTPQSSDFPSDEETGEADALAIIEEEEAEEPEEEDPNPFVRGEYAPKSVGSLARLGGTDRYATAVAISKHVTHNDRQSNLVFVATGSTFPDALSIGALASYTGSPLLLVPRTGVPTNVVNEIQQLGPSLIVIAGGTGAVSAATEARLARIAEVQRVAGSDRYETSAAIAELFPQGAPAFVTTGQNFPDATVAAAPAGKSGGPVVLTRMGSVHPAAAQALEKLEPSALYVIGGTWGAAARSALSSAAGQSPTVLSGKDRFATSAKVAQNFWGTASPTIVYARGNAFPDALTGVAVSRAHDAPLLLTNERCRPDALKPVVGSQTTTIILGGSSAVSDGATKNSCSELVLFDNGVYTFQHMTWEMQETGYYCGPASGKMALKGMRRTVSASGYPLSQKLLAGPAFMRTDALGYTQGETNDLIKGLNAFLGSNVYRAHRNPSGPQLRAAVLNSFTSTKRPVLLGTGEVMGGYRYNAHPTNRVIGHYVVVYGFDTKTNELLIMDSAAGLSADYRNSARIFRYNVNAFADRFLRNFWHHGYYY